MATAVAVVAVIAPIVTLGIRGKMDENLLELKLLRKRRLFLEIITQTEHCGLRWRRTTAVGQYTAEDFPYKFFLTPTSFGITLDILKEDGCFVSGYNSAIWPDIQFLYDFVSELDDNIGYVSGSTPRTQEVLKYVEQLPRDCKPSLDIIGYGRVVVGGSAIVSSTVDATVTITLTTTEQETALFPAPWAITVDGTSYSGTAQTIQRNTGETETFSFNIDCGSLTTLKSWKRIDIDGTTDLGSLSSDDLNPLVYVIPDNKDFTLLADGYCSFV